MVRLSAVILGAMAVASTAAAQNMSRPSADSGVSLSALYQDAQYDDRDRDYDRDRYRDRERYRERERDRPPAFHCAAELRTSEGPRRTFCDIRPQPVDTRCECPTPRPPRGYPPYPPAYGHAVP